MNKGDKPELERLEMEIYGLDIVGLTYTVHDKVRFSTHWKDYVSKMAWELLQKDLIGA